MLNGNDTSFRILHRQPDDFIETRWRACLAASDLPMHYTAPEYFFEPALRSKKPFAVLSMVGEEVTGILTGIHEDHRIQSGLSVRPQTVLSRHTDPSVAMSNLIAGLVREAGSGKLVDLFVWADMADLVDARFRQRRCDGVVMLDLSRGPDALFREFSENKRTNIKKAIKYGVSVDGATNRDDISAYYAVYVDWARRKALPIVELEEFQAAFALTNNRRLLLAWYGGQVIAGVVLRFFPGGVVEYAANSSLQSALHLRPNDLLHWRAIEWACAEGMTKYSLGGTHLFLRKFGGAVVPTTRHRLDRSVFRRYAIGDWIADRVGEARPFIPARVVALGRSLGRQIERFRPHGGRRSI